MSDRPTDSQRAADEGFAPRSAVQRSPGIARLSQFIDYAFFLIYLVLLVRLVLPLIGARSNTGFSKFIVKLSDPFYGPFKGIIESHKEGSATLVLPIIVAIGAYLLLHLVINRLLRVIAVRKTEL